MRKFSVNWQFLCCRFQAKIANISSLICSDPAWKVSVFGVILALIFPHLDWIRRNTPYISVFIPNAGICGPEQLWIRTLFTQCEILWVRHIYWLSNRKIFQKRFWMLQGSFFWRLNRNIFFKVTTSANH